MPTQQPSSQSWRFLTEDAEAILAGLREAEFEHIYPASPTLFDRFLSYLDHLGVRETLDAFPDHRPRRSIPVRFLTQTLLVRPLCAVSSLAQLDRSFPPPRRSCICWASTRTRSRGAFAPMPGSGLLTKRR